MSTLRTLDIYCHIVILFVSWINSYLSTYKNLNSSCIDQNTVLAEANVATFNDSLSSGRMARMLQRQQQFFLFRQS